MKNSIVRDGTGRSFLGPFILIASLFFLWGFAHSILDVLNKHFQDVLVISKARSGLVQATVYGGYFLMALPAGSIIRRWGYRAGIVLGLVLYGIGALMFIPGGRMMSFPFFLLCLFVIGCGLTCLETSANPYVTVLGEKRSAARRLNLAQSLNGLGWIAGPLVGGLLILGDSSDISLPYAVIGMVVLVLGLVFSRLQLPDTSEADNDGGADSGNDAAAVNAAAAVNDTASAKGRAESIWSVPTFRYGVPALFFYVAAQTGINSFFINYVTESGAGISPQTAALMLSFGGMGLFMAGRLIGSAAMDRISPRSMMLVCSAGAIVCMTATIFCSGYAGIAALCLTYLFESVMFPTIFSMALTDIRGEGTKTASSFLIMSIVGGAIAPVLMGLAGENDMAAGFLIPLGCFVIVGAYSAAYRHLHRKHIA